VLAGRKVFVDDKNLVKLPENYFFIHDLIDTVVFMKKKKLGVIKDVLKLPANDVLVIEKKDGSEEMIPFVLDFIEKFDPEKRKMTLKVDENFLKDIDEN
jgi:16S rRNA processing protein RimM